MTEKEKTTSSQAETSVELAIASLEALAQPWNSIVRAALSLLKHNEVTKLCNIVSASYPYSAVIQKDGKWQCSALSDHAKRTAICIVLEGMAEVVGIQPLPKKSKAGTFSAIRPLSYISLEKGGVLGTYEFTGNLFQRPEKHGYQVMAGPVCLQFDHPDFCAFKQNYTWQQNKLYKLTHTPKVFQEWRETGLAYKLIQAIADEDECKKEHAKVLFLDLQHPSDLQPENQSLCETFRNVVVENAWSQSLASRGRDFKASTLDLSACDDVPLVEKYATGISATLVHLEEVLNGVGALWSPTHTLSHDCPALASFLNKFSEKSLSFFSEQLLVQRPLLSTKDGGIVSLADFIHRYEITRTGGFTDIVIRSGKQKKLV